MCNQCHNPNHLDIPALLAEYEEKLATMQDLMDSLPQLNAKDQAFGSDLVRTFQTTGSLSGRQWPWVKTLADRVKTAEPIYGDFRAVEVMFQLAASNIKTPKIRLMTNWRRPEAEEHRFVQLTFRQDNHGKREIEVHLDGWAGHGYRKFAGWIKADQLIPYRVDRMTDDVKNLIQDFSLDPARVSRACAGLLGACSYCGSRLSDDVSKALGYGPTCADNYGLPHGKGAVLALEADAREAQERRYSHREGIGG